MDLELSEVGIFVVLSHNKCKVVFDHAVSDSSEHFVQPVVVVHRINRGQVGRDDVLHELVQRNSLKNVFIRAFSFFFFDFQLKGKRESVIVIGC